MTGVVVDPSPLRRFPRTGFALVALSVLALFLGSSIPRETARYSGGDLLAYYLPTADHVGERLAEGSIPFWNPEVGGGLDQFGNLPQAVCYPPTWLFAFLPVRVGMPLLIILHLGLAGSGMYCWLRTVGLRQDAVLFGVAVLLFGLLGEAWWPPLLFTAVWIPWIFYFVERLTEFRPLRWCALAACFACQLLAGFPQYFVYTVMLILPYAGLRSFVTRSSQSLLWTATALALGCITAGVQLVPSYFYYQETWRQRKPTAEQVHYLDRGELPYLSQVVLTFGRNVMTSMPTCRSLSHRETWGYLGVVMPLAVALGLVRGLPWRTAYFSLAMAAGLYLSAGHARGVPPLYEGLSQILPLFGSFRAPGRLLLWFLLGASYLTAVGVECLWGDASTRATTWLVLFVSLVLLGLRVFVWYRYGGLLSLFVWTAVLLWVVGTSLLNSKGFSVPGLSRGRIVMIAFGLVLLDLTLACGYICPYLQWPIELFDRVHLEGGANLSSEQIRALAEKAGSDRILLPQSYPVTMRSRPLPPFRTLPYYESIEPARNYLLMNALLGREQQIPLNMVGIPLVPHRRLLDWASVRLAVAQEPIESAREQGWEHVEDLAGELHVYANRRVIPRVSLWDSYHVVAPEEALQELVSAGPIPVALGIALEEEPTSAWQEQRLHPPLPGGTSEIGQVELLTDEPERIVLGVHARKPVLLLLGDTYALGWRGFLNGVPVRILHANYLHRAIEIPTGEHLVEFRYWPRGLNFGLALTGFGLSILAVTLVVGRSYWPHSAKRHTSQQGQGGEVSVVP